MNPVNRLKFYDPTILTLSSPKIILMYNHPHWFSLKSSRMPWMIYFLQQFLFSNDCGMIDWQAALLANSTAAGLSIVHWWLDPRSIFSDLAFTGIVESVS